MAGSVLPLESPSILRLAVWPSLLELGSSVLSKSFSEKGHVEINFYKEQAFKRQNLVFLLCLNQFSASYLHHLGRGSRYPVGTMIQVSPGSYCGIGQKRTPKGTPQWLFRFDPGSAGGRIPSQVCCFQNQKVVDLPSIQKPFNKSLNPTITFVTPCAGAQAAPNALAG